MLSVRARRGTSRINPLEIRLLRAVEEGRGFDLGQALVKDIVFIDSCM